MSHPHRILITGSSGLLGTQLMRKFSNTSCQLHGLGRSACPQAIKLLCKWHRMDLSTPVESDLKPDVLIHCAPLWYLPGFLEILARNQTLKRCIVFSSTSVISKADAGDAQDRELAEKLSMAEAQTKQICGSSMNLTIFRPSMIYGYAKDKNITVIANFIKKHGFFPLAGQALGLRQPVHVDDLVQATFDIINKPVTFGKTYSLAGAEKLSYKSMVEKIFLALERPVRPIRLPVSIYRLLLKLQGSQYSQGTANRMNQNLAYDIQMAINDFEYDPHPFLSSPARDLP